MMSYNFRKYAAILSCFLALLALEGKVYATSPNPTHSASALIVKFKALCRTYKGGGRREDCE